MKTYSYACEFEPGENPDIVVVTFPDVPQAITEGIGKKDAREQASEALGLALLAILRSGHPLPKSKTGVVMISPHPDIVAKLAVIETFQSSKLTQVQLALKLGKDEKAVRRILDPMHATKLSTLVSALYAMNARLVLGLEAAE